MAKGYDNIAWFYDRLARLIYGKTLVQAQQFLIAAIPADATILIAGGGTGWILEELAALHPSGLKITYVEISAAMIALAKKKDAGGNKVVFINSPVQIAALSEKFDVVLTPFLFDNFSEPTLGAAFQNIHNHLKENGLWLFADFQISGNNKTLQKMVLKVMYTFFRITCGIEATSLPDMEKYFSAYSYQLINEQASLKEFIVSKVFRKSP